MNQIEFEKQVREMRQQKAQELNPLQLMAAELKEEIAAKNRQIHELQEQLQKLKAQKAALNERQIRITQKWGGQIQNFIKKYQQEAEHSWDNISTYTIVKQLRKRGWEGDIYNNDPAMADEHKQGVIAAFTGKWNPEEDNKENHDEETALD